LHRAIGAALHNGCARDNANDIGQATDCCLSMRWAAGGRKDPGQSYLEARGGRPSSRATCGTASSFSPSSCLTRVRREIDGKERVRVPYDEDRASHSGPESCVSRREAWGEALTGETVGPVLSHVTESVRDADAFRVAEGNTARCAIASAPPVSRGLRPWHVVENFCTGVGRSHDWPPGDGRSAPGRPEGRSR
jgi:hypothetical protein